MREYQQVWNNNGGKLAFVQMAVVDWAKWQTAVASFTREMCNTSYKVITMTSACFHPLTLSHSLIPTHILVLHLQGARLPQGWIGFETIIVGEVCRKE